MLRLDDHVTALSPPHSPSSPHSKHSISEQNSVCLRLHDVTDSDRTIDVIEGSPPKHDSLFRRANERRRSFSSPAQPIDRSNYPTQIRELDISTPITGSPNRSRPKEWKEKRKNSFGSISQLFGRKKSRDSTVMHRSLPSVTSNRLSSSSSSSVTTVPSPASVHSHSSATSTAHRIATETDRPSSPCSRSGPTQPTEHVSESTRPRKRSLSDSPVRLPDCTQPLPVQPNSPIPEDLMSYEPDVSTSPPRSRRNSLRAIRKSANFIKKKSNR